MDDPNAASMRRFNHYHAKKRVGVENVFGRLKALWHVFRMIHAHPCLSASVQEACTALHNFFGRARRLLRRQPGGDGRAAREQRDGCCGRRLLLSAGQARRLEIVKALGLPWAEVLNHTGAP